MGKIQGKYSWEMRQFDKNLIFVHWAFYAFMVI